MEKNLKHFGVLGMKWGKRKSQVIIKGSRALTRDEDRDEQVSRKVVTSKSKNPHAERREADLIMDRAARESDKNLGKALDRFARENDLKNAVKRGYVTPPKRNIEEMSSKEIDSILNSDARIRKHLENDFDRSVNRGKAIAATVLTTYALVKVSQIVINIAARRQLINAMAENIGRFV